MFIIVISVLVEGPRVPVEFKGDPSHKLSFLGPGIFRAIGVISFAFGEWLFLIRFQKKKKES